MKALATIGTGPMEPVLDLALPTFRAYADRYGYEVVVGDGDSQGRPPSWAKVLLMKRLLNEYDEVLWIDADAIILRNDRDISDEVPPDAWQAFAMCPGWRTGPILNCGVWLIRSTDKAKSFLDLVWSAEHRIEHRWWEQMAVLDLLGFDERGEVIGESAWLAGTCFLDDVWNRCEDIVGIQRDDRIRHYAGRTNDYRLRRMIVDRKLIDGERWAWLSDIRWRRSIPRYKLARFYATPPGRAWRALSRFPRRAVRGAWRRMRR